MRATASAPDRRAAAPARGAAGPAIVASREFSLWYGAQQVLDRITLEMPPNQVTAIIGPSGCGKSSYLRSFNRMNDGIRNVRSSGEVLYRGIDVSSPRVRPRELRRRVGMIFQRPNPLPKSIHENLAFALRVNGCRDEVEGRIERALRDAALWDEVKDGLRQSALALSGGQQQRLCLARALIHEPDVLLMDEPCSALDPIATARIEELVVALKRRCTVVVVTHNMQQAARVSDRTVFLWLGRVVEAGPTAELFQSPAEQLTADYLSGRFG